MAATPITTAPPSAETCISPASTADDGLIAAVVAWGIVERSADTDADADRSATLARRIAAIAPVTLAGFAAKAWLRIASGLEELDGLLAADAMRVLPELGGVAA